MSQDTWLFTTITIALAAAFLGGLLATRLHLPAFVGYLLAGMAIGPFTPGVVADSAVTQQLADLGIVLLMFGVGIEFSPRDLLKVSHICIPGPLIHATLMAGIGLLLGHLWGWGVGGGLVFGLAISACSTVVMMRALSERGEVGTTQGAIAMGWAIAEDLRTVLILVLLPALAGPLGGVEAAGGSLGSQIALALVKVALLGAFMALVGNRAVPHLLERVASTGPRELFTVGVLAVVLGVAYVASRYFGVSLALGAFLAGAAVAGSEVSEQAAAEALPVRDAFAVLFFVAVGMLFDPAVLLHDTWHVITAVIVVVIGKALVAALIVAAYRYPAHVVRTVAAAVAQVGEFSFILAELGRTLGLLGQEGYALIIMGSLFSIAINPLLFRVLAPSERRAEAASPSG